MKKFYSRKDGIVLTAIDIINDVGFQALSIREIAKRQDMAESLLYKNYKSKDEVIVAVLKFYSKYDTAIMNTVLKNENSNRQKIIDFVCSYAEYYENYPAITSILTSYEAFLHEASTQEIIKSIFRKRNEFISDLVESSQKNGEMKNDYSVRELTDLISGLVMITCLSWRVDNFSYPLKDRIIGVLDKLLQ